MNIRHLISYSHLDLMTTYYSLLDFNQNRDFVKHWALKLVVEGLNACNWEVSS